MDCFAPDGRLADSGRPDDAQLTKPAGHSIQERVNLFELVLASYGAFPLHALRVPDAVSKHRVFPLSTAPAHKYPPTNVLAKFQMTARRSVEFVAECFWPGVTDADVRALDDRATAAATEVARTGRRVRYLGSILMREDEVVLCLFEGSADAVRLTAEQAKIPFERILESAGSPWPALKSAPRDSNDA